MARHTFGGTTGDYVIRTSVGGAVAIVGGTVVNFYSAATSGTHYTDLLNNAGSGATTITAETDGSIKEFQGPDGITTMWADAGGAHRVRLVATDASATYVAVAGSAFGGGITSARQPFNSSQSVDAAATGATDKVGHGLDTTVTGDLSASTGSNATTAWGLNVFTTSGAAANAGNGGTITNLIESNVQAASGTVAVLRGLEAQAALYGAAVGATVTQAESLRVSAPARKNGAVGGSIGAAYSLFVDSPTIGTSSNFALFVNGGGVSRFSGRVDVNNTIANNGNSDLSIFSGFSTADGGSLLIKKSGNGGHVIAILTTAGSKFKVSDGAADQFTFDKTGLPQFSNAANAQTTVGAAGGASALPATPTKYFKVQDSAGTTLVIPAYAAS